TASAGARGAARAAAARARGADGAECAAGAGRPRRHGDRDDLGETSLPGRRPRATRHRGLMQDARLACAAALALAWAWDAFFGEPRNALHPVAWLGRGLAPLGRTLSAWRPVPAFVGGALAWCAAAALLGAAAWAWQRWALGQPWP